MVQVQKQKGIMDCGVFAIALMTSIAFNGDPSKVHYQQEALVAVLCRSKIIPFCVHYD